jgi:hypothetical protein
MGKKARLSPIAPTKPKYVTKATFDAFVLKIFYAFKNNNTPK